MSDKANPQLKVSVRTHSALRKIKGAVQFKEGSQVTFGEAAMMAVEAFLDDPPENITKEQVVEINNHFRDNETKQLKLPRGRRGGLRKVEGYVEFQTGENALANTALWLAILEYEKDLPFPVSNLPDESSG